MFCQIIQRKQEEKQIEEEQATNAQYWKIPACCGDDDDYNSAITPNEPVDSLNVGDEHLNTISATESDEFIKSCVENLVPNPITPNEPVDFLSMGDEHLNTIPAMESDEFIKSYVENLVSNPSKSEGENGCDMHAGFTTFSNVLFDAEYDSDSSDDQSLSDEDAPEKIYSNPLFDEEIISMEIDPHSFNAESDLMKSMLNNDSSIIIPSKIDSLFDEFAGELTLLKSIPPEIDETDCHPTEETHFTKRLLYDNSYPRPLEEFVSDNSN
nr:hypothetical protein [Tanacetum cinerariifolium]